MRCLGTSWYSWIFRDCWNFQGLLDFQRLLDPPNPPPNSEIFLKRFFGKSSKAKAVLGPPKFSETILGISERFQKKRGKRRPNHKVQKGPPPPLVCIVTLLYAYCEYQRCLVQPCSRSIHSVSENAICRQKNAIDTSASLSAML